jgi:hypothetical protein
MEIFPPDMNRRDNTRLFNKTSGFGQSIAKSPAVSYTAGLTQET